MPRRLTRVRLTDIGPYGRQRGVRAYPPAVERRQEEAVLDLSAVHVPAGQGLFLVVEPAVGS